MKRSYDTLLKRLDAVTEPSVALQQLGSFSSNMRIYTMVMVEVGIPGPGKRSILITAGIHGDEPAGVEAALRFIEEYAVNSEFLTNFHAVVFPCCNPSGFELDTRENAEGIDLNREFSTPSPPSEINLIMRGISGRCFDLLFDMHEDIDAPGLYLYEITNDSNTYIGEKVIEAVRLMGYPINPHRVIEHRRAHQGIIRRNSLRFRKTRVPQAIYTYRTCGSHIITLEPPASVLPLEDRVRIELVALDIALRSLLERNI